MRCAIILSALILSSTLSLTTSEEDFNNIVPEQEFSDYPVPSDDFIEDEDDVTKDELDQIEDACSGQRNSAKKADARAKSVLPMVKDALDRKGKLCAAQAKANEKREKANKSMGGEIEGPTFKFKSEPCKGGKGKFTKKLKKDARATVGVIPANQNNVKVSLKSKKDVDIEVWGPLGKVAIVAWDCKNYNQLHKTPTNCLDTDSKKSLKYGGARIVYSGYNGVGNKLGHEYIRIKGKSKEPLVVKAYAYKAGTANVEYSWGADPAACVKKKHEARKAALAKHDALVKAKASMKEKGYKTVEKLVSTTAKDCEGASAVAAKAKKQLAAAKKETLAWEKKVNECVKNMRKEKAAKKEKKRKREVADKAKKERGSKAKERARKKAETKRKEKAEKKELQDKAEKNDKKEKKDKAEKAAKAKEKAGKQEKKDKAEKAAKEKVDKAEKKAKAKERKDKAKEKAAKAKEKAEKKELSAKAEKKGKEAEKAMKAHKERATKAAEKKVKEINGKEQRLKEHAAKAREKADKNEKKTKKENDAKEKARKAAQAAIAKRNEIKSKKCATRTWRTNTWLAWTNCCTGCDGRSPSPGGLRGSCITNNKYSWGRSKCTCRATPSGTTDFTTNRYYFNTDCCAGCKAAQSQCIRRNKGFAWTSVCTCRMHC